jgi:hypothetical protein
VAALAALAVLGGCGKKGPPQPPLRPLPARITDITARAVDARVDVSLLVPLQNADGTTPPVIDHVELYALAAPAASPAPVAQPGAAAVTVAAQPAQVPASAIVQSDNLVATLAVAPPATAATEEAAPEPMRLVIPHDITALVTAGAAPTIRYVAVGIGRGRRGQTSPVVAVPLERRPDAPQGLAVTFDATTIAVSWAASAEGIVTHVDEVTSSAELADRIRRSTTPATGTSFTLPVSFGDIRCFEARHAVVVGRATVEGPAAPAACVTPTDQFAPPAPGALVAIAENGVVVLSWRGVEAADLAGYLILRGEGASETLQPLTPSPMTERSYRDATVRPGVTYTYAVVAVDRAQPPNRSPESNRQTVTARD